MSVAMYPGAIPFTWTLSLLHSLLRALVSWPRAPLAEAYAGTVIPPYNCPDTTGIRKNVIVGMMERIRIMVRDIPGR